jgi:3-hydroxy-3-methylglutaryl CoA synthase
MAVFFWNTFYTFIFSVSDPEELNGKKALLFSYGSGCASAMFSLTFNLDDEKNRNEFENMRKSALNAAERMESRVRYSPDEYTAIMKDREELIESESTSYKGLH